MNRNFAVLPFLCCAYPAASGSSVADPPVLSFKVSSLSPGQALPPAPNRLFSMAGSRLCFSSYVPSLMCSEDMGDHWKPMPAESISKLNVESVAISPSDPSRVWAVAGVPKLGKMVILGSRDGGESWAVQLRVKGIMSALGDIWFSDSRYGWAVGSRTTEGGDVPLALWTQNGGGTWHEASIAMHDFIQPFMRVRFVSLLRGWAVGGNHIIETSDGGRTWALQADTDPSAELNGIEVVGPNDVWVTGGWNLLLHTRDGGRTWMRSIVDPSSQEYLWTVRFATPNIGWVAGQHGRVYATTDGGATWKRSELPVDEFVRDLLVVGHKLFILADGPSVYSAEW